MLSSAKHEKPTPPFLLKDIRAAVGKMEHMRDWFLTKCKEGPKFRSSDRELEGSCDKFQNVVTPNNIPEFTIPRSLDSIESLSGAARESPGDLSPADDRSQRGSSSSVHTSPRNSPSPRGSQYLFPGIPARSRSTSAPVSPFRRLSDNDVTPARPPPHAKHQHSRSGSVEEMQDQATNADPLSMSAMGLSHFKTKTAYGFDTLTQAPHTRRKESLFHDSPFTSPLLRQQSIQRQKTADILKDCFPYEEDKAAGTPRRNASCKRVKTPSLVIAQGSTESSEGVGLLSPPSSPPCGSPSPSQLSPHTAYGDSVRHRRHRLYYRRRSSATALDGQSTTSDDSSRNPSPEVPQQHRAGSTGAISSDHSLNVTTKAQVNNNLNSPGAILRVKSLNKAATAVRNQNPKSPLTKSLSVQSGLISGEKQGSQSHNQSHSHNGENHMDNHMSKLEAQLMADRGELKFSVRYLPESRRLKVVLIKAENLGCPQRDSTSLNPFFKLCLLPGKLHKQVSKLTKGTRNPHFNNQEFYFPDLNLDRLREAHVRIRAFHRANNIKREEFLGEIQLSLDTLDLLCDNRMWKNLEDKVDKENLGFLEMRACYEPVEEQLKITVVKATELPKHCITGAPNAYVKIFVAQSGRPKLKKQTKTCKNNTDPIFDESFSFKISPREEDLKYTSVTLTLFNYARLRTDDVIGQVRLGYGATEDSELEQWKQITNNPSQDVATWHTLMDSEEHY